MRTSLIVVGISLGLITPVFSQTATYAGCGGTFNTCASVQLSATQLQNGRWLVTMIIRNTSYDNTSLASKASGIRGWFIGGLPVNTSRFGGSPLLDEQGNDYQGFFTNESSGFGDLHGVDGYTEELNDDGNVVHGSFGSVVDQRCLTDPACTAFRPVSSPAVTYVDISGAVHFTMTLSQWPSLPEVWIRDENVNDFQLTVVSAVPEPATMVLLGTGLLGVGALRRRFRSGSRRI